MITLSETLTKRIENVLNAGELIAGADLQARAASSTDTSPHAAIALLRPRTTQQLSEILKACHEEGQKVAVQGGMTGLVSGGDARPDELAISLELMNEIEAIDPAGKTISVGAGVTIQAVQETAAKDDLLFAVDWGARGSAMVGGAIATNAGGNAVLRYGMMREQVLGLEAVLPDGTVLSSMNRLMKNNTGYDLKQLFIGSEGTLGIVTRAVLRLHPMPTNHQTALVALDSFDDVVALLGKLQLGFGSALSSFEVMWQGHYKLIVQEGNHQWVIPDGHSHYVIVETSGTNEEKDAERFAEVLTEIMEDELIADAVIATSHSQRQSIWEIREDIDSLFRALNPPITFDVSVPLLRMEDYANTVRTAIMAQFPNAKGTTFGHLGDGNLHFCWSTGDIADKDSVSQIVYDALLPLNGSVSAEHGIGTSKRKYLSHSRNADEIMWMEHLKRLFDPKNILNPGRVVDIT